MEHCANCNEPLKAGQAVCPKCGAETEVAGAPADGQKQKKAHTFGSICGVCGALLPDECSHCLVCGTERGAAPYDGVFPVSCETDNLELEPVRRQVRTIRKTPDLWRRWSGGISAVILLVMLGFAGIWVYRQYFDTSSYRAAGAVLYETADQRLMLYYPGMESKVEVTGIAPEGTARADGTLCPSPSGRWLTYRLATGQVYLMDLAGTGPGGPTTLEAALLAENVAGEVRFAESGDYLIYITKDRELYASDLNESWRLDSRVEEIIGVEDQKILYTRHGDNAGSGEGQLDLFLYYLPRDGGEWLTIDRGVVEVLDWTHGFEKLLYTSVRTDTDGDGQVCLHSFDLKASTTTMLVTGIGDIMDVSAATGSVVYGIPKRAQWTVSSFINDDMASADARVSEPKLEDYPALEEAIRVYGEEGDFYTIEDNEELLEQDRAYNTAVDEWEDIRERAELRQRLRRLFEGAGASMELYDLYVYRAGAVTMLDSGVLLDEEDNRENGTVNVDQNYVLYEKVDAASLKKMKMSELWEHTELRTLNPGSYFLENTTRELRYTPLEGGPVTLYVSGGDLVHRQWRMSPKADGVYFAVEPAGRQANDGRRNELYYANVRTGAVDEAMMIAQGVDTLYGAFRDGLLFDLLTDRGKELYIAQAGTTRRVGGSEANPAGMENGANTLLYFDEYTKQTSVGTLRMLTREDVVLSENAIGFDYRGDQLVYVVKPGKSGSLDLYSWTSGRETLIEREVRGVVNPAEGLQ